MLQYRGITLDLGAARLTYGEKSLELGRNEQKILHRLFEHAGNIVSREKLAAIGLPGLIQTKRGMGYKV